MGEGEGRGKGKTEDRDGFVGAEDVFKVALVEDVAFGGLNDEEDAERQGV